MLEPGQIALISVATPPQSFIREFPAGTHAQLNGYLPVDSQVEAWLRRQRPGRPGDSLFQVPTFNSPLWGDAAGAFRTASLLSSFGTNCELQAERLVTTPVFRDRNVIFFGNPEYSPTITRLLQGLPLTTAYDTTAQDHIVIEYGPHGEILNRFLPRRDQGPSMLKEVYGLITVLPGEGKRERPTRYIIFSGISSAGTQAAAEYFASTSHLEQLAGKIAASGKAWPEKYQVLVRASSSYTIALSFEYQLHRILH
jgi:hypothetical protein